MITQFDLKAVQTRDCWELQIAVTATGFSSKAALAYAAGSVTALVSKEFGLPKCGVSHNFDSDHSNQTGDCPCERAGESVHHPNCIYHPSTKGGSNAHGSK